MNFFKPYYHIKNFENFDILSDYNDSDEGAIILERNDSFFVVSVIPSTSLKENFKTIPENYDVSNFKITDFFTDSRGYNGKIASWLIESEDKAGGSLRTYALQKELNKDWSILASDGSRYYIKYSKALPNQYEILKVDGLYTPYIEIEIPNLDDLVIRDCFSFINKAGIITGRFQAWRVFGLEINDKNIPADFIGVHNYGAYKPEKHTAEELDFIVPIKTNNEDITLNLNRFDKKRFIPRVRNNAIILDHELGLFLNINKELTNDIVIKTKFYLQLQFKNVEVKPFLSTKIEDKEIKLSLCPKLKDKNFYDSYLDVAVFKKDINEVSQRYFFVLEYDKDFLIFERILHTSNWHTIDIIYDKNEFKLEVGNIEILRKHGNIKFSFTKFENPIVISGDYFIENFNVLEYTTEIIEPFDHFIDYKMIDFYNLRCCAETCKWHIKKFSKDLDTTFNFPGEECPFNLYGIDPYKNVKNNSFCSETTLIPINYNYPAEFSDKIIQSPHYKIDIDIDYEPFNNNAVINETQCNLLYSIFEEWRPISRVSHYELSFTLTTDFSGEAFSKYANSGNVNWVTRFVGKKMLMPDSVIHNNGEVGFNSASSGWTVTHTLDTVDIVAQTFDLASTLMYPSEQYAIDSKNYFFDFSPNKKSGYALIQKAEKVVASEYINENPLYIVLSGISENAAILQTTNNSNWREEIMNFSAISFNTKIELLELFAQRVLINTQDVMFYVSTPARVWKIQHNLGVQGLLAEVYNDKWEVVKPSELILLDENTVLVYFDTLVKGTIGLRKVGNPFWQNDAVADVAPNNKTAGYILLGEIADDVPVNWDYGYNFGYTDFDDANKKMQSDKLIKIPITNFTETELEYVFIGKLPAYSRDRLKIREAGLFTYDDKMVCYAQGNLIYVTEDFEIEITFKLAKTMLEREDDKNEKIIDI